MFDGTSCVLWSMSHYSFEHFPDDLGVLLVAGEKNNGSVRSLKAHLNDVIVDQQERLQKGQFCRWCTVTKNVGSKITA